MDIALLLEGANSVESACPSTRFRAAPTTLMTSPTAAAGHSLQDHQHRQKRPQHQSKERQPPSIHACRPLATATRRSDKRGMTLRDQPAKKPAKWSEEEDALIIKLRGREMRWEDISKRLPGRSAISCRLHYQKYLERRSAWSEERKNKLAQLYQKSVILFLSEREGLVGRHCSICY